MSAYTSRVSVNRFTCFQEVKEEKAKIPDKAEEGPAVIPEQPKTPDTDSPRGKSPKKAPAPVPPTQPERTVTPDSMETGVSEPKTATEPTTVGEEKVEGEKEDDKGTQLFFVHMVSNLKLLKFK